MRRLGVVVVLLACALCAGAAGTHRFAGLSRADAGVQATAVVRTFAPSLLGYEDARVFRYLALVDVMRSRDSMRREAWLAVFRYAGRHDAACVWVRRATAGPWRYSYEETQSVANGRTDTPHERCVRVAFRLHLLGPNDEAGSEIPVPAYAYPTPVSPFGVVPHGSYLADLEDTGAVSLSGVPARFPQSTAPGTSGIEGFVIDERTWRVIPGARLVVTPSTDLSGFSRLAPSRVAEPYLAVTADRHGAFAILNLPARRLGYDFTVTAPGYGTRYEVHQLTLRGLFTGDFQLGRTPRFADDTPGPPPCGTGC